MWRDALLVAGKDLRIEYRSKVTFNQVVPFALIVVVLFGLALGPDRILLETTASGLFWIAVLLVTVLAVQRSFAIESADDARDGLRLSGLDPGGIFVGKAGAIAVELVILEVILAIVASFLYDVHLSSALFLGAVCVVATIGLSAIGTLYGAVAAGTRVSETLLPLLFFPVVAPVLLAATNAWKAGLAGSPSHGLRWFALLGALALSYGAIGTVAFGSFLEDR
jgi:heme exporter protein B